eukprot:CAMPEP_0195650304 /NCGR_PEP_ID=MMETSP0815-20121206/31644_1 /TAXON_ID=97485 /ORGANISM="Prymnesium parvum, Strain Texoma1" /LENGTH=73 /DNA_ID=CAMNT_0040794097 /DNA_START=264 /DNA_END=485 /DNA_ORIENTATION=+
MLVSGRLRLEKWMTLLPLPLKKGEEADLCLARDASQTNPFAAFAISLAAANSFLAVEHVRVSAADEEKVHQLL